jgi:hypothetical protein
MKIRTIAPTLYDYRDLTIDQFYKKYDNDQYQATLNQLLAEKKNLETDSSEDAKKRLQKVKKTLAGLTQKTLSPSAGISVGFVVQDNAQAPHVVFVVTHDARNRGFRFSLNGTLEKTDASWHAGRLREFQEETLNSSFVKQIIDNMPTKIEEHLLFHTDDKTELARLKNQKFMYISQQAIYIDCSKIYSTAELQHELILPLHKMMQDYSRITSNESGQNIFANFMFAHGPVKEAVPQLVASIDTLLNLEKNSSPFTDDDIKNLKQLRTLLGEHQNDDLIDKTTISALIENSVMKYSEACGIELMKVTDLKQRLSQSQKDSGIFEPNYEMFKVLGEKLDNFIETSLRRVQKCKSIDSSTVKSSLFSSNKKANSSAIKLTENPHLMNESLQNGK